MWILGPKIENFSLVHKLSAILTAVNNSVKIYKQWLTKNAYNIQNCIVNLKKTAHKYCEIEKQK